MPVYSYSFNLTDRLTAGMSKMTTGVRAFKQEMKEAQAETKRTASENRILGGVLGGVGIGIAQGIGNGIRGVFEGVVNTTAKFQTMGAVLTNTLGSSSLAQKAMDGITSFAAKTPFQIDELTDSYVKLANNGFRPTEKAMTSLGDLASSKGKGFEQLTEAVLDAQVGEFERLKEFGIRAQQQGDKVQFTFKGVTKTVGNNEAAIRDYILSLGEMNGVQGSMAAISSTLAGKQSNFGDKVMLLQKRIGDALTPAITKLIDTSGGLIDRFIEGANWAVENQEKIYGWGKAILWTVGVTGTLVAALRAFQFVSTAINGVRTGFLLFQKALTFAKAAQIGFNIAAAANPIGIIVVSIGAAIAAITLLIRNWDTIKTYLVAFGQWVWKNHPFRFLIELMDRVFPGFKKAFYGLVQNIVDAFKKAWAWIEGNIVRPIKEFFAGIFKKKSAPGTSKPTTEPSGLDLAASSGSTTPGYSPSGMGGRNLGIGSQVNDITSKEGPGNIKNITINIQKMVDGGINITSSTMEQSYSKMKAELEKILMAVVNDVNYG